MRSPPFGLTPTVLELSIGIGQSLGQLAGLSVVRPQLKLRRENRIRTIQGTVAIEGNSLSTAQITAMLEGKRVLVPPREVLEVQNALLAYERASTWSPWSEKDLLAAHQVLMKGLLPDAGRWRKGGAGVVQGSKVAHVAPPARRVPALMSELLEWGRKGDAPLLIKACVLHYEIQFIHPFADGNGRMGRLWQHVVLLGANPLFEFAPVESIVQARQAEYYAALGKSDRSGDCAPFLEFSLSALQDALQELSRRVVPEPETATSRLDAARAAFAKRWFTRAEYLALHRRLSRASASRDLREGVESGSLERRGDRRTAKYVFRK